MPYKDPEQARLNQVRYRVRHRDAIKTRRAGQNDKIRADARARYAADPEKARNSELWRRYKIHSADYERMLVDQQGKCKICGTSEFHGPGKRPHIDHDHTTGAVRGLLCVRCNVLIGMARENPEVFRKALQYLEVDGMKIAG